MTQPVPVFTGRCEGGRFRPDNPEAVRARCFALEGKAVDVKLAEHEDTRSAKANAYLWTVVYPPICEYTGSTDLEVHEAMKQRFLKRVTVRAVNHATGEVVEDEVIESSTLQTISGFYWFVESIRAFAGEWMGLYIPDPDPDWREKKRKKAA